MRTLVSAAATIALVTVLSTTTTPAAAQNATSCTNINELTKAIAAGQKNRVSPAALLAARYLEKTAKAQSAKRQFVLCNDSIATGLRIMKGASPLAVASEPVKPAKPGAKLKWVKARLGYIPHGAVEIGREKGKPLYLCRAEDTGKVHPGKVVNKRCNVTYGGREKFKNSFEVLTGDPRKLTWVRGRPRNVKLFFAGDFPLCRVFQFSARHPGKLVKGKCNVGWRGRERSQPRFEIATLGGIPRQTSGAPKRKPLAGEILIGPEKINTRVIVSGRYAGSNLTKNHFVNHRGQRRLARGTGVSGLSFWIKPVKALKTWSVIFHKGAADNQRAPALFFGPATTKLHFAFDKHGGKLNQTCNSKTSLPIGKWSHILVQYRRHQSHIHINGKVDVSCAHGVRYQIKPNKGPLYLGSPWHKPANAQIQSLRLHSAQNFLNARPILEASIPKEAQKEFKVSPRSKAKKPPRRKPFPAEVLIGPEKFGKPKVIANAQFVDRWQYSGHHRNRRGTVRRGAGFIGYSFWIKPRKVSKSWTGIFHKGAANDQRAPALFIIPGTTKLHFRFDQGNVKNVGCNSKSSLKVGQWSHVLVQFRSGLANILINSQIDSSCKFQRGRLAPNKGPLYLGSPWNPSADAIIQSLRIHSSRNYLQPRQARAILKQDMPRDVTPALRKKLKELDQADIKLRQELKRRRQELKRLRPQR